MQRRSSMSYVLRLSILKPQFYMVLRFTAFHDSWFFLLSKDGIASNWRIMPSVTPSGKSLFRQKKDSRVSERRKQYGLSGGPILNFPFSILFTSRLLSDISRESCCAPNVFRQNFWHSANTS